MKAPKIIRAKEVELELEDGRQPPVGITSEIRDLAAKFRAGKDLSREEIDRLVNEAVVAGAGNGDCNVC
ncbi:MAG: hypothetical protein IPM79_25390 [Polyangiaceae bacterium]|nr:hypothetical protein [Polyangiaceae bacterium]